MDWFDSAQALVALNADALGEFVNKSVGWLVDFVWEQFAIVWCFLLVALRILLAWLVVLFVLLVGVVVILCIKALVCHLFELFRFVFRFVFQVVCQVVSRFVSWFKSKPESK